MHKIQQQIIMTNQQITNRATTNYVLYINKIINNIHIIYMYKTIYTRYKTKVCI